MSTKTIAHEAGSETMPSLWSIFRNELLNGSFFPTSENEAEDPNSNPDDKNNQELSVDHATMIQNAFFPSGSKTLFCKLLLRGWAISTFIIALATSHYPWFEMAFLTNWSMAATIIYMGLSFLASLGATCSLSWASCPADPSSPVPSLRTFFVKAQSIFFTIAAVQEFVVLLFWCRPSWGEAMPYVIIMGHGPLSILVLLDGLVLNSIPLQARNICFVWVFQCLYMIWSGFYSVFDLMNPINMMMSMDEAIYRGLLNWRLYPGRTLLVCLGILLVLTPLLFGFVWTLSYHARRIKQTRARTRAMMSEWADQTKHPMSMHFADENNTQEDSYEDSFEDDETSLGSELKDNLDVEIGLPPVPISTVPITELNRSLSVYSAYSV